MTGSFDGLVVDGDGRDMDFKCLAVIYEMGNEWLGSGGEEWVVL